MYEQLGTLRGKYYGSATVTACFCHLNKAMAITEKIHTAHRENTTELESS